MGLVIAYRAFRPFGLRRVVAGAVPFAVLILLLSYLNERQFGLFLPSAGYYLIRDQQQVLAFAPAMLSMKLIDAFGGRAVGKGAGKDRRKTTRTSTRSRTAPVAKGSESHTRSFPCPDDLWSDVERFAGERELGSPAAAARLLLRSGLSVERRIRELQAARDWQIEEAWTEIQAIAAGDRTFGSWDEIEQAAERARLRVREREAAQQRVAAHV